MREIMCFPLRELVCEIPGLKFIFWRIFSNTIRRITLKYTYLVNNNKQNQC